MRGTISIELDGETAKAFVGPVGNSTSEISAAFLGASQEVVAQIRAALAASETETP